MRANWKQFSVVYATTVNNTEKDQTDQNNLDERTTSVGSKDIDRVASDIKTYIDHLYYGTNVQENGLVVDGIEPKEPGTGSNSKTVDQYNKTTLQSSEGNLTRGKTLFSRFVKQGLLVLGRGNDEKHCSRSEENALLVVFVEIESLHQIRFRKKCQKNMAGTKPETNKQTREVKKQRGPASGNIYDNTNIFGFEKVAPYVPPRKTKTRSTFIEPLNEVAVNPISDVPKHERVLDTKFVFREAAGGRLKARLVTAGWMQRHDTDYAIVAAKDKFGRSQNGALDQGENQSNTTTSSWVKCPGTVASEVTG